MRDYKPTQAKPQPRARWLLWFIAGLGLPLVTVALLLPDPNAPPPIQAPEPVARAMPVAQTSPGKEAAAATTVPATQRVAPEISASTDIPPYVAAPEAEPTGNKSILTVGRGDSLDRLFRRNDFSAAQLALIMREEAAREHLRLIRPGDQITVWHDNKKIQTLRRELDYTRSLQVTADDDGFSAKIIEHKIIRRQVEARGRIGSSLFLAAADAGVSDRTIMNLAGIFAWDIDFVLDIRRGDEFHVIVEELWRNGEKVAEGNILAAQFVNQGEVFQAIRYEDPEGRASYFSPDGNNMRKAFLRAPLSFSRISSNFNPNRRHPVLNTIRAHKGVDYAAPSGTPVKAAGDGKITFRGVKGGYGYTVIVQHGGNVTTLYAHLKGFNKKFRNGSRVKQGDIVAYVGQSGLATGPHLHYEYRRNGVHMNPRTVKLPDAAPIKASYRDDFLRKAEPLITRMDQPNAAAGSLTTAGIAATAEPQTTLAAAQPD
jgi:murein DD-endopeptidase MepM/ murein hydrolase activator NlpD